MKSKIRILCILMALVLSLGSMALMAGCGGSGVDFDDRFLDGFFPNGGQVPISAERAAAMEEEASRIRVVFPGNDPNNVNSQLNRAMHRFMRDHREVSIEFIPVGWSAEQIQQLVLASIIAGMPYDLMYVTATDFALYYSSGLLQSWDNYLNYEWLASPEHGTDNDTPLIHMAAVDGMFTRGGERYIAVPWHNVSPFMTFYNRTMLEYLNMDSPYDLWRNGEWTMEAMHEMAVRATRDTTGTGTPNYWGITTMYENIWINQNHTSFVTMNDVGEFQLNLDDPALTEALEMFTDIAHSRRSMHVEGSDARNTFYNGATLFFLSEWGEISQLHLREDSEAGLPFDWGLAPLPFGPNNTDEVHMVFAHGAAMINGTRNPHTAATIMEYMVQEGMMVPEEDVRELEPHWWAMYEAMLANPFYSLYYDVIVNMGGFLIQAARNGQDIAEAIERQRAPMQALVDAANLGWTPPTPRDHDPYFFDFEDWTAANLMIPDRAQDSTTLEVVTDGRAISGNSILISAPLAESATSISRFMIDAGEFPLFGFNTYVIEFDIRVVGEMQTDTQFFAALARSESGNAVMTTITSFTDQIDPESGDEVQSVRIEIIPAMDDTDFAFVIGGQNWADIVIDNLRISQLRAGMDD